MFVNDTRELSMEELDLRGVICPYNFVKTKLKLDTLEGGTQLAVLLDAGDPIHNVPKSIMKFAGNVCWIYFSGKFYTEIHR